MAILKLSSGNKNLSYVIQKNPNSGLFLRSHKNGVLFGYFPIDIDNKLYDKQYIIYFKDSSDSISYKRHPDEEFEYLNSSKYNDARFINDCIQEVLHSAREGKGDSGKYDIECNHMLEFNLIETEYKTINIFQKYFPEINIEYSEISKDNYNLKFISENKMTLKYLLQVVNLFGIFAQLNSPTYSYITEDLTKKYLRIINEIDAPYFIRYLFKVRMIKSLNLFNLLKNDLEKSDKYKLEITNGDTHQARIDFIISNIDYTKSIIDIGTGIDFKYLKLIAPKLKDKNLYYHAIEIDYDARERIRAGIINRGLEDVVFIYESLNDFFEYYDKYLTKDIFSIICTEVLEHNTLDEAKQIVRGINKKINFDKFIITIPNKDFNINYAMDAEFRHIDHKWEGDIQFIINFAKFANTYNFDFHQVGDKVNNISTSLGFINKK